MKSKKLLVAVHGDDGEPFRVGYFPQTLDNKPYMLIIGNKAIRGFRTLGGASRALLYLAGDFDVPASNYIYSDDDPDDWKTEKNVDLLYVPIMRRETVKVF